VSFRVLALSSLLSLVTACGAKVAIDPQPGSGGAGGTTTSSTTTTSTTTTTTTTGTGGAPFDAGADVLPPPPVAVYANSGGALFLLDPAAQTFGVIGNFKGCEKVVDLAVDRAGRIFVTTPMGLFRVDAGDATCTPIGGAGNYPNSLSFVPAGTLDPEVDALVGFLDDKYVRIDENSGAVTTIGSLNGGAYVSSGDLVALPDGRTYLTVKGGGCQDCLVQVDPKTGTLLTIIGKIGFGEVYGLAYWGGVTYGFTKGGGVLQIDLNTGNGVPIMFPSFPVGLTFWGAGSSTAAAL
jgi:hypothetical protein